MANNDAEFLGWVIAILMFSILPVIIFVYLKATNPGMEWKRSIACYVGWIPGNVISCWYLHYSIGFINSFMILFMCQVVQLAFVFIMGRILINWFGFNAFK